MNLGPQIVATSLERDAMIPEIAEKLRRQLEEQLPGNTAALGQIETAAGKIGRQHSGNVKTGFVKQRDSTSGQDINLDSCFTR